MARLEGKVAMITGGAAGIGAAAAHAFAREGATVFVVSRRGAVAEPSSEPMSGKVIPIRADVTQPEQLRAATQQIAETAERLDVLYANAGVRIATPLGETTVDQIDTTLATNLTAVVLTVQAALPLLIDGGSIILGGSVAGATAEAGYGIYGASKAGVRSLARTWADELRSRRIRVNTISPGPTDTPMMRTTVGADALPAVSTWIAEHTPAGRVASPEDIADAALFLATDDSRFVNGTELVVDGGLTQI